MSEIDDLRKEIEKLSSNRQWWIAVVSALIAALASVVAAYFGFSAQKTSAQANREISLTTNTFDVYQNFGKFIITGTDQERCRALLLMLAVDTQPGTKIITEGIAEQLKCEEPGKYTAALHQKIGSKCLISKPTHPTLRGLSPEKTTEASSICSAITSIPKRFVGPWPDGTISFSSGKEITGRTVWCRCLPKTVALSIKRDSFGDVHPLPGVHEEH